MTVVRSALIIPDVHFPFHSVRAWELMLECAKSHPPDEIVVLGDFLDAFNLSMHGPKNPSVFTSLTDEIDSANAGLDQLDHFFPKSKKVYLCGNHEYRFERYVINRCPELFGITTIDRLLNMNTRNNWMWIHYGARQAHKVLGTDLYARHEPLRSNPKATLGETGESIVYGHIHRLEMMRKVNIDGRHLVAFSPGWLGNKNAKAFDYVKNHHQWPMGFAYVYALDGSNDFSVETVHIKDDYSCAFQGRIYFG